MRISQFYLFVSSSFMACEHADAYSLIFDYNFVIHNAFTPSFVCFLSKLLNFVCQRTMLFMSKDYAEILPPKETGKVIPKVVHQTHRSWEALAPELLDNIEQLKRQNPDWEYRFYDDMAVESYILKHYGATILDYYRRIDVRYGAARADLFRYLLIYNEGGVYLDIKSSFATPIDSYLQPDDCFILSHWDNLKGQQHEGFGLFGGYADFPERGEYQQFHIEAVAGHPLLRAVLLAVLEAIDNYSPYTHNVGRWGVFHVTGPVIYSQAISRHLKSHKNVSYRLIDNGLCGDCKIVYNIYDHLPKGVHRTKIGSTYRTNRSPVVHPHGAWQWVSFNLYALVRGTAAQVRRWILNLKG